MYGDLCNSLASNLFEKTRKISEATHPPSVGHLNPPLSGEVTKKGRSEKLKIKAFIF
jgi:hypothetical protein